MSAFRVGDRVRCVNRDGNNYIEEGGIYVVRALFEDGQLVKLDGTKYEPNAFKYRASDFELVDEPAPEPNPETEFFGGFTMAELHEENQELSDKLAEAKTTNAALQQQLGAVSSQLDELRALHARMSDHLTVLITAPRPFVQTRFGQFEASTHGVLKAVAAAVDAIYRMHGATAAESTKGPNERR